MVNLVLVQHNTIFHGKIQAVPIHHLYLHEEIINSNLNALIGIIKRRNIFQDPIIVDEKSGVVLDGMHRTEALRRLGYDYIVAYLVDYYNPLIKIRKWCRLFRLPDYLAKKERINNLLREIIKEAKLEIFTCKLQDAERYLQKRKILGYIVTGFNKETTCIESGELDIHSIYFEIRKIEKQIAKKLSLKINYYPDEKFGSKLNHGNYLCIVPPQISKDEVISCAVNKKLFPPKSTRHIIPLRPFFVNIPLKLLKKSAGMTLEQINKVIDATLMQRRKIRLRGKIIIDRLYEDDYIDIFA